MRQILLQNATAVLLQNATVLLKSATVIAKCDDFITNRDIYYKMRRLLQIATVQTSITNHILALSKCTDICTSKNDNLIFLGDFNVGVEDTDIKSFCSSYILTSMVKKVTCYKNPEKPTCIDLILTNCP